jgi:hypothetical protein
MKKGGLHAPPFDKTTVLKLITQKKSFQQPHNLVEIVSGKPLVG